MTATPPPRPARNPLQLALFALLLLSLIPAALLAVSRLRFEQGEKNLAIVMDYQALTQQARQIGQTPLQLLAHYRTLGVNGVSLYEDVIGDRVQDGSVLYRSGADLLAQYPQSAAKPNWYYLRSVKPGTAERLATRYTIPTEQITVDSQSWVGWPAMPLNLPAGPNRALIDQLQRLGYVLVYRPFDYPAVKNIGADWPNVPFIAFNGLKVVGANSPEGLRNTDLNLGSRIPAIIESNPQKGLDVLLEHHPGARLFSIRPEWQGVLTPEDTSDKFVLAARERSQRLLYIRPFETVDQTDTFLKRMVAGIKKAGIEITRPTIHAYQPSRALRLLSLLGPLAALGLLALSYPLTRLGLVVGVLTLLGVVAYNGGDLFGAGALLAAVTFPALGLSLRRERPTDWLIASGISLLGIVFLSALGTQRLSMLGLDPFKGVGLTLVLPIALFALSLLPRQDIRKTAYDLYRTPLKLGDIALILGALAVIALVVLRRGNTPAVGVSATEAKVRAALQDTIIRPRFKELAGHPLAILGLSKQFPPYLNNLLLIGGVVGQSSILNTFSHFHTPFWISLQRVLYGLGIGGVIGFVLIPLVAWGIRFFKGGFPAPAPLGVPSPHSEPSIRPRQEQV